MKKRKEKTITFNQRKQAFKDFFNLLKANAVNGIYEFEDDNFIVRFSSFEDEHDGIIEIVQKQEDADEFLFQEIEGISILQIRIRWSESEIYNKMNSTFNEKKLGWFFSQYDFRLVQKVQKLIRIDAAA